MIDLKNEILKNGGFTIDYQLKKAEEKKGYYVSEYGTEKTIKKSDIKQLDAIIEKYQEMIKNKKNVYIGAWISNDIIYIDISKHYKDKKQAIKQGIYNKQLAIYDIANNCSIDLLKNVYIVYKLNKINNDLQYIKEYNNIKDIEKDYIVKNAFQYICKNIDNIKTLLNDKFIIVNDKISYNEI